MKNNQTTQHKPSQLEEPNPQQTSKTTQPSNFWAVYYWILLVVLSGISLGVAVYGYNKLFNVNDLPQIKQNRTITIQPSSATSDKNSLPVWMIIAIALGCTTGCLVIFRFFKWAKEVKKNTSSKQKVKKRQIPPSPPLHSLPGTQPLAEVMPSEEINATDSNIESNSESLADLLDIRQQTSITSVASEKE